MSGFDEAFCKAKVDEEEGVWVTDGANDDVLRFNVSVNDTTVVDLLQPIYHLIRYHQHCRKCKPTAVVLHLGFNIWTTQGKNNERTSFDLPTGN